MSLEVHEGHIETYADKEADWLSRADVTAALNDLITMAETSPFWKGGRRKGARVCVQYLRNRLGLELPPNIGS